MLSNYILRSSKGITIAFSSNADYEMVIHTINAAKRKPNMIMEHDSFKIKHELDWVSYHLRRFGYVVDIKKKNINSHIIQNVPTIEIPKESNKGELSNGQKRLYVRDRG